MTRTGMIKKIEKAIEKYEFEYSNLGIRFENKERTIGEEIEDYSKSNADRDDEREFPEYGSEEYEEMDELDGVCAYYIDTYRDDVDLGFNDPKRENDIERFYEANHCYILGCDRVSSNMYAEDEGEIIMEDAKVLDIIF